MSDWKVVQLWLEVRYVGDHLPRKYLEGNYDCLSELEEAKDQLVLRLSSSGPFVGVGASMIKKSAILDVTFIEEYR